MAIEHEYYFETTYLFHKPQRKLSQTIILKEDISFLAFYKKVLVWVGFMISTRDSLDRKKRCFLLMCTVATLRKSQNYFLRAFLKKGIKRSLIQ